jgi:hypothetical protein
LANPRTGKGVYLRVAATLNDSLQIKLTCTKRINMTKPNFKMVLSITATLIFLFLSKPVFSQINWFKVGSAAGKYEMAIDSSNLHEGKNVMTLKSVSEILMASAL